MIQEKKCIKGGTPLAWRVEGISARYWGHLLVKKRGEKSGKRMGKDGPGPEKKEVLLARTSEQIGKSAGVASWEGNFLCVRGDFQKIGEKKVLRKKERNPDQKNVAESRGFRAGKEKREVPGKKKIQQEKTQVKRGKKERKRVRQRIVSEWPAWSAKPNNQSLSKWEAELKGLIKKRVKGARIMLTKLTGW